MEILDHRLQSSRELTMQGAFKVGDTPAGPRLSVGDARIEERPFKI
jgi:hypothetical protein